MARRKKPTVDEAIVFGKLCGCGKCRFCQAWQDEETILHMLDQVRRGKQIAESAREEVLRNLKKEKSDE
jgi:hypothetical protein